MSGTTEESSRSNSASEAGNVDSMGNSTGSNSLIGPNFDSLHEQKRSTDPESIARRESLAEQRPGGFFSKIFKSAVAPANPQQPK
ncbi:uncharacterized protein BCR38DRAFT_489426 [Pseudomassariella vexata]|uniref:Uncharacterized protein n=1 Tax=Pseudomassariella vexata TaxID=1141098 RepID=A0A1Y2DGX4_9PEZI|nr:uncharacterized protein BCR38DRAFT_489426 [Pseudomassariella vexata]ORY58508.1 hypothetical protein BCR38DRAFT_489426 [Pseudomassariella vexata]